MIRARMIRARLTAIVAIVLAVLLTSCSTGSPNRAVVEKAIALQVSQTQAELGQLLYPTAANPSQDINHVTVSRVQVTRREPITIKALSAYRVQGTYDVAVEVGDRQITQRQNSFDLYLQQQPDEKKWRLARPQIHPEDTEEQWVMTAIEP